MNPTPALESLLPSLPQPTAPLEDEASSPDVSFDALLNEASEEPVDAEPQSEEKAAELLAPLLFFAPPPKPEDLTLVEIPKGENAPVEATLALPQTAKQLEAFTDLEGSATDFAKSAKEAIPLDPKLFEAIAPEPAPPEQTPEPPPEVQIAGTLAAQQEKHVKNTEKTVEIAAGAEQKMPEPALSRRAIAPVQKIEAHQSLPESARFEPAFSAEAPSEIVPVKTLDTAAIVETLRSDVAGLRLRGASEASVTIRPEHGPELRIDLQVARDGSVHAVARVEKGDSQALGADWPRLQQSLAALGIQMADLNSNSDSHRHSQRESSPTWQEENQRDPRRQQPEETFETQFAKLNQPRRAAALTAATGWQSFA